MARSVKEWVGKTDDTQPPPSVKRRLYRKQDGRCPKCSRYLVSGNITCDHIIPLWVEGGPGNRETNLQLICTRPCSIKKTGAEAAMRARANKAMDKRLGFKAPSKDRRPPMPGTRRSKWKKKLDGTVVRRDEE